ncbi:MAG: hypothetical protein ABWY55_08305 [Microbacterium sp.]
MDRRDASAIVAEEGLTHVNLFERSEPIQDEVGITASPSGYIVYVTDERASIRTADEFDDESDALEHFIRKARLIERVLARGRD